MNRGYRLDRGRGVRRRRLRKGVCPACGKRGLGVERIVVVAPPGAAKAVRLVRSCRYCQHAVTRLPP